MKACWKAFDILSPQEQLNAANELRQSNLKAVVNPSAYFRHIINRAMYTLPKERSSPTSPTADDTTLPKVQTFLQAHGRTGNVLQASYQARRLD